MENPFEIIMARLDEIESLIKAINKNSTADKETGLPQTMTLIQTAEYLGLSKATMYGYTASREIPHFKRGKRLYFRKAEIDQWISEGRVKTQKEIEIEVDNYLSSHSHKSGRIRRS